jgi:hypothetical protein
MTTRIATERAERFVKGLPHPEQVPSTVLDQPTAQGGAASLISERRCLISVDRFRNR